jgi:hypothetical protein
MSWNRRTKFNLSQNKDSIIMGLLVLGIILNIFSFFGREKQYVLTNGAITEEPELNQFCTSFVEQILHKSLHVEMVEPDIYEVLVHENYKVLNLTGSEKVLFSKVNADTCAVVIKDKLGLRRLDIWVNKSIDYPFYFRVQKIDEPLVEG